MRIRLNYHHGSAVNLKEEGDWKPGEGKRSNKENDSEEFEAGFARRFLIVFITLLDV
jgi:hypothetical protein